MDTKWKNNISLIAWLFLFTFGLSGLLPIFSYPGYYRSPFALLLCLAFGLGALVISLFLFKNLSILQSLIDHKWRDYYDRIPVDVALLVFLIFAGYTLSWMRALSSAFVYGNIYPFVKCLALAALFMAISIIQVQWLVRRLNDADRLKTEWEKTVLHRAFQMIGDVFLDRSLGVQTILLLGIVFASGFGILVVMIRPPAILIYIPLFLIVTVPALTILFRRIGYFNRIVENATGLARGNVEPDLHVKGRSALAELAESVNKLKHGVEVSQAEQAKSERFKAELITNVSHDLRTPLTSIITYTELLKTPELTKDEREAYVEIIDRKSKRLKVLIEDLFEASKMASGSIQLVREKVDLTQLLQQALAENDEMIRESTLQFRVSKPDAPVLCVVDGQKIWRVFDNLIGNILKYSMDHTRVYITVKDTRDGAEITFKNITKYELGEDVDELFERFKRGDTSRHTDGSGLGLAIAKSIVDLHGGRLDIALDGDLFKVTVFLSQ